MNSRTDSRAFTLIEILVVIVIIGISAMAVVYVIKPNVTKTAERFGDHLTRTIRLVQQYALLTQSIAGVDVQESEVRFFIYSPDEKNPHEGSWKVISEDVTEPVLIVPKDVRLALEIANQEHPIESEEARFIPEIMLSMNGRITPFQIKILLRNGESVYRIQGEVSGAISGKAAE